MCRSVKKTCLWLCTLFPAMKLDLPVPLTENISRAMSTFSTPWSPLTLKNKHFAHHNIARFFTFFRCMAYKIAYCGEESKASNEPLRQYYLPWWKSISVYWLPKEGQCCWGAIVVCCTQVHDLLKILTWCKSSFFKLSSFLSSFFYIFT